MSYNNQFFKWRSDQTARFDAAAVTLEMPKDTSIPQELREKVEKCCLTQYYKATRLMEYSVGEVAIRYVHEDGDSKNSGDGPLLRFAKLYSQRYLDLFEAFTQMEHDKKIPMIPVVAGQLKARGFTSQEILSMKNPCKAFTVLSTKILEHFSQNFIEFNRVIEIITTPELRKKVIEEGKDKFLIDCIEEYKAISRVDLLDKAHFMLRNFGHMSYSDISMQLYYVGIMDERLATPQQRLLMEIRHRIAGDTTQIQNSLGSLGSNPLAYLNMLKKGEPDNKEAEFRERMYFVYQANHFANDVIQDQNTIDFINKWLKDNNKGWQLDSEFIAAMNARGPSHIPPVFRYGTNASLNKFLRTGRSQEGIKRFNKENLNPTIRAAMNGLVDINSYFNLKLSERELMNQTGEFRWNPTDKNAGKKEMNFSTGAAYFRLILDPSSIVLNEQAKEYLEKVNALQIPVVSGISGTLDQSTTMAGLVGIGTSLDPTSRQKALETVRLAYLAFMLPGHDHSVHEIMQSSRTFGLKYVAGPGYQKYLYPAGGSQFLQQLSRAQEKRGTRIPDYFLSEEYISSEIKRLASPQESAASIIFSKPSTRG